MPQNFIECDREQSFLLPPDIREWLPDGHLGVVHPRHGRGGGSHRVLRRLPRRRPRRAAYEPSMMLALVLYAYARGVRSTRAIERACEEDVAFRVLAANQKPDHATLARFIERHEQALADLFGEVLTLCEQAGLVKSGVVAIDGTKIAANASREATMDYKRIAEEIIEEAKAIDAEEDELYGEKRGDELPEQLTTTAGRKAWLREAKHRLDAERAKQSKPVPRSRPKRLREAKHRLEEELSFEERANDLYEAWRERETRKRGRGQMAPGAVRPYVPPDEPEGKINLTDPDSRLMKDSRGFVQGYNAQVTVNEKQIVLAAEVMLSASDFGHLEPMVDATEAELRQAGVEEKPQVVTADAGYWHQPQMESVVGRGMPVLIPPDGGKRRSARPGWDKGLYAFMRRVLQSELGGELYRKRKALVEPMFANTKYNRRLDRFRRRRRAAARSEWRLITATHNLLKLHQHQIAAAEA